MIPIDTKSDLIFTCDIAILGHQRTDLAGHKLLERDKLCVQFFGESRRPLERRYGNKLLL